MNLAIKVPSFKYNIVLELHGETAVVDWGNQPGWIEFLGEALENATRFMRVPKDDSGVPVVSVTLGDGRRWILFSRVIGSTKAGLGNQIRLYAIGWQKNVGKSSVRCITWVYPDGLIEVAEEPSFVHLFLINK